MSIIKRAGLFKILLVASMILLVAGMVQAAEGIKLIASEEQGKSGDKIQVTISVENAAGVGGGEATLNFEPALVKPVADEPGELVTEASSGLFMANREYDEGQLKFMWVTPEGDAADEGIICVIDFELLGDGETELDFADLIFFPEEVEPAEPVSGRITIAEAEVGQEEIEADLEKEEEAVAEEEIEEEEFERDEEVVADGVDNGDNYTLLIVLIALFILAAAGFVIFKRPKKAKH